MNRISEHNHFCPVLNKMTDLLEDQSCSYATVKLIKTLLEESMSEWNLMLLKCQEEEQRHLTC